MSHPIAESLRRWVPHTDGPDTLKFTGAEEIERQAAEIEALKQDRANALRQSAAIGWDAAVAAMRYEDGTKVELAVSVNPYRT